MIKRIIRRLYTLSVFFVINTFLDEPRPKTFALKRALLRSVGISVGENTKVVGPIIVHGKLIIGSNCWIGAGLTVHGNGTVVIKDNVDFGPGVVLLTGGHKIGNSDRRAGDGESYNIEIENGCWIGARSTILGNTTIGDGSIVAACSCVINSVPDNSLAAGIPALVKKELSNSEI